MEYASILELTFIPPLRYEYIYHIALGLVENCRQYEVTIGNFLTCTCMYFITMMTNSLAS